MFVHGFTGDPLDTWTLNNKKGPSIYWPRDLASKTISDSRILTYGYDTKIRHVARGPVSKKTVYDHAWDLLCSLEARRRNPSERRRPILFIAHSLGGIIVKEALRRSQRCTLTQAHLRGVFEAVVGVLFFGTPHRGADPRNPFHHFLSATAQALGAQVNHLIVNALMPESERLAELRDEFAAMYHERKWRIFSFQEEYGLSGLIGTKVVDDQSSCLDDPIVEIRQHISSNHMDMCRFSGLEDPEYSKVAAAMTLIVETVGDGAGTVTVHSTPTRAEQQIAAGDVSPGGASSPGSSTIHLQSPAAGNPVLIPAVITDALEIEARILPSRSALLFIKRLPDTAHGHVADIIFSNCKAAFFTFYRRHRLHRSKFDAEDGSSKQKLFQLPNSAGPDRFPQGADDFSLEDWIHKFIHLWTRRNEPDTVHVDHFTP